MTVGLPGVGIGGIFYLMSALTMPVRELVVTARGESSLSRWKFVAKQWSLAAGILAAMWLTGKLLGLALAGVGATVASSGVLLRSSHTRNVLQVSALGLSLGTLLVVWLGVHVTRAILVRRNGIPRQALEPMPAAASAQLDPRGSLAPSQLATGTGGRRLDSGPFRRAR
jgi:hypothetical protein